MIMWRPEKGIERKRTRKANTLKMDRKKKMDGDANCNEEQHRKTSQTPKNREDKMQTRGGWRKRKTDTSWIARPAVP